MDREQQRVSKALGGVADLYASNLDLYGFDSRSVGWRDEASQMLRFRKLAQVLFASPSDRGIGIVDYGCGYGAMFHFVDEIAGVQLDSYYGYDISEQMLAGAARFISDSRAELVLGSEVRHDADFSFVSGTFNVRMEASDEHWEEYIKTTLLNLAAKSSQGIAFNLLTSYVDWKQENLYYGDPAFFFDFCKKNISPYVTLLHDYPLFEWTMIVHKIPVSR
jgi:SAM-dependent methyltransferase